VSITTEEIRALERIAHLCAQHGPARIRIRNVEGYGDVTLHKSSGVLRWHSMRSIDYAVVFGPKAPWWARLKDSLWGERPASAREWQLFRDVFLGPVIKATAAQAARRLDGGVDLEIRRHLLSAQIPYP
jgi:hypothetical protein